MFAWGFGHFCAIAVGVSLGLMGGGGAILAVPILIYVIGVEAKSAIAISLVSVGTVSAMGAFLHWQKGNVRFDVAALFAPAAMVGAYLGALLASFSWVSESFQLLCFSMIMLLASLLMIIKSRQQNQTVVTLSSSEPVHKKFLLHQFMIPVEGMGIGVLTGFVGIGGGFAIVPALVLLTGIPIKQAVGTSLLIISLKSVTGFLGYLSQLEVNWALVVSFTFAASLGTLLGSYCNRFVNAKALQAGFGYFVLFFAALILLAQFSLS
ncbi:MAG: sulfite exporter TauE/SafE family protein [Phormidesmis sp.]